MCQWSKTPALHLVPLLAFRAVAAHKVLDPPPHRRRRRLAILRRHRRVRWLQPLRQPVLLRLQLEDMLAFSIDIECQVWRCGAEPQAMPLRMPPPLLLLLLPSPH
jgi:hypothetical protein